MSTKAFSVRRPVSPSDSAPIPLHPPVAPAAVTALSRAKRALQEAEEARTLAERFIGAYEAALKAAAAVVSLRGRPQRTRSRPVSVWILLEASAPELAEWSTFFGAHSALHSSVQAGITRQLTFEATEDLIRQTRSFVELVRGLVYGGPGYNLAHQPELRAG